MMTKSNSKRGFTLIELISVITIIVILMTFLIAGTSGFRNRARKTKARTQIAQITTALEAYRNDFLLYPNDGTTTTTCASTVCEDNNAYVIQQLSGKNSDGTYNTTITGDSKWNGPYFDPSSPDVSASRVWLDPWLNAFNIRLAVDTDTTTTPPSTNRLTFDIWSNGSDGTNNSGGGDDINNWS